MPHVERRRYDVAKRAIDVTVSAVGLVLSAPVQLVTAAVVLAAHGRPVLFRQPRPGRDGVVFELVKFRTMRRPDAAHVTDADRLTSVGRILRSTSLDELPTLWNVLKGDMSLVGPRPEVPHYMALYPAEARAQILSVRPGITDRAAIEFRDEERILAGAADPAAAYVAHIMPVKQRYYLDYVAQRTLIGDLRILFDTVRALLR